MNKSKLILLNKTDNVFVCCQEVRENEDIAFDDKIVRMKANVDLGHKIARKLIIKNEKIIRYGVAIGSATADIKIGEHVHMHNMKSDYIPSHTRQAKAGN